MSSGSSGVIGTKFQILFFTKLALKKNYLFIPHLTNEFPFVMAVKASKSISTFTIIYWYFLFFETFIL
jgi:hypothetical protein